MLTLSVIGVEDGALVAAGPSGERFRIPVDDALRARLLSNRVVPTGPRVAPREIQAQVRAGLSAEQVAAATGAQVSAVQRYVGPVLAERAYVLDSARAVRVRLDDEEQALLTFGAVVDDRIAALDARDIAWTALKEPGGDWFVVVSFTADEVAHRARWRFDPKRLALTADDAEATGLSQQGSPVAFAPRLRALETPAPTAVIPVAAAPQGPAAPAARRSHSGPPAEASAEQEQAERQEQRPSADATPKLGQLLRAAPPVPATDPDPATARFDSGVFDFADLDDGAPEAQRRAPARIGVRPVTAMPRQTDQEPAASAPTAKARSIGARSDPAAPAATPQPSPAAAAARTPTPPGTDPTAAEATRGEATREQARREQAAATAATAEEEEEESRDDQSAAQPPRPAAAPRRIDTARSAPSRSRQQPAAPRQPVRAPLPLRGRREDPPVATEDGEDRVATSPVPLPSGASSTRRRTRTTMPSWNDIVWGKDED